MFYNLYASNVFYIVFPTIVIGPVPQYSYRILNEPYPSILFYITDRKYIHPFINTASRFIFLLFIKYYLFASVTANDLLFASLTAND